MSSQAPGSYEQMRGHIELQIANASAPPMNEYNPAPAYNEGDISDNEAYRSSQVIIPKIIDKTSSIQEPRKIFIIKDINEPTPIIAVITRDMVNKYPNQHIVYPKSENPNSSSSDNDPLAAYHNNNPISTSQEIIPIIIDATKPRKILILKDINEPTPIITIITADMVHKYPNQHIVYPQNPHRQHKEKPPRNHTKADKRPSNSPREWSCSRCTFKNKPESNKCEMCNTAKPVCHHFYAIHTQNIFVPLYILYDIVEGKFNHGECWRGYE